jgi:hypothetical protein
METDQIRMESDSDNTFYYIFTWNTNMDSNVLEYEYKTDVSNSDTHSDNIYQFSLLEIYNYKIM